MPRAQASPNASRSHHRTSPVGSKPSSKRQHSPPDVLELTSSPDITGPASFPSHKSPKSTPVQTAKKKSKQKPSVAPSEVIEISSDEDDLLLSQESILADLRRQVKKLKQENERHMKNYTTLAHELARCRTELKEVNARASEHKSTDGKIVLDPSQLEDGLNCEICTRRMYAPYLLPDCGHTFCLSCLQDWFGTTHARFIQAHPHWSVNTMNLYIARIQGFLRPEFLNHPNVYDQLLQMHQPLPEYTCPTCRKRVLKRPVEVYALKALARTISAADKSEERNIPPDELVMEHQHGQLVVADPWEGLFPGDRR